MVTVTLYIDIKLLIFIVLARLSGGNTAVVCVHVPVYTGPSFAEGSFRTSIHIRKH